MAHWEKYQYVQPIGAMLLGQAIGKSGRVKPRAMLRTLGNGTGTKSRQAVTEEKESSSWGRPVVVPVSR